MSDGSAFSVAFSVMSRARTRNYRHQKRARYLSGRGWVVRCFRTEVEFGWNVFSSSALLWPPPPKQFDHPPQLSLGFSSPLLSTHEKQTITSTLPPAGADLQSQREKRRSGWVWWNIDEKLSVWFVAGHQRHLLHWCNEREGCVWGEEA